MRPLKILLSVVVLLSVAFLDRAEAPEPRTALIIGNADYSFAPLKNPINDADAMATALEGAGFKVIKETDADQAKMVEAVRTFGTELKQRGGVGLFYFSGHGTQIDGENGGVGKPDAGGLCFGQRREPDGALGRGQG